VKFKDEIIELLKNLKKKLIGHNRYKQLYMCYSHNCYRKNESSQWKWQKYKKWKCLHNM